MIENFPTAEETRTKNSIYHFTSDMKTMLEIINQRNDAGNIFALGDKCDGWYTIKLNNKQKTFDTLKELGYIIKQAPKKEEVYSIWWEVPFLEEDEINDSTNPYNWEIV